MKAETMRRTEAIATSVPTGRRGFSTFMKLLVNRNVHNAEKELTASTQVVASVVLTFTLRFRREFCGCDAYNEVRRHEAGSRAAQRDVCS